MLSISRVPRTMASVLMSLALAATTLVGTAGVASAQVQYDFDLEFAGVPSTVLVGQAFSVRVEIQDDNAPATGCASRAEVTLSARGPGSWQDTATAVGAVATFSVTLDSAGAWDLVAEVLGGQCSDANFRFAESQVTAVSGIPPGQPVAPCPGGRECEQVWNGGNIAATLIARPGSTFIDPRFVDYNRRVDCARPPLEDNGVLAFDHSGGGQKMVIFGVDQPLIKKANKPLSRFRVCWKGDDDRKGRWLRRCHTGKPAPCILFKRRVQGGALIGVLAPAGDPRAYFH